MSMFDGIAALIDGILKDAARYSYVTGVPLKEAEYCAEVYPGYKERAILGDKKCRDHIISRYVTIMRSELSGVGGSKLIDKLDFKNPWNNPSAIMFEMLLDLRDITGTIDRYSIHTIFREEQLKEILIEEAGNLASVYSEIDARYRLAATVLYAREYGQHCIDTLQHHKINEIGAIGAGYVYIIYKGEKIHLDFISFENTGTLLNIQKKTTRNSAVGYDEENPTITAVKLNTSRITVAGYDVAPSAGEIYYNERIFNLDKISMEEMRDRYRTIDGTIYEFLKVNQAGKGSHFITGSDMGVGKSTFMTAMMGMVPDKWGIGILDTQNELQARMKYPDKNIITLIRSPKRSVSECFTAMLKMSRDVLYVGEITTPDEVSELINAALRLNSGVGATMHSLSPEEALTNLRNLLMKTGMYNAAETAENDLSRAIDIVIHLSRHPVDKARIIVDSICGVEPVNTLGTCVRSSLEGWDGDDMQLYGSATRIAIKNPPLFKSDNYLIREILKYDISRDKWYTVGLPCDRYFRKLSRYVPLIKLSRVIGLLKANFAKRPE